MSKIDTGWLIAFAVIAGFGLGVFLKSQVDLRRQPSDHLLRRSRFMGAALTLFSSAIVALILIFP